MSITYGDYLKINELLDLQQPLSPGPEHDELLFIVIHQTYELWFKQVIHELDHLTALFNAGERNRALHTLKRVDTIFRTLTQQVDILETLTPLEFMSFRDRLQSASGFQSVQFRELEMLLGLKEPKKFEHLPAGSAERARLELRFDRPTLWDAFLRFLHSLNYRVPQASLSRDLTRSVEPSAEVQKLLIEVYRKDPLVAEICEALVDLDTSLQQWRYRHVKMVERTIGSKIGTGGSAGADYLKTTLFTPVWPDLWHIRAEF
ncbi:tryptophan 2,3-dioxygenase [Exilibacterium tricleocarpae]|uniref:Tryptophan 2,3-dioxygenase n=1 Tax=Exilibacterium tricleocarpae TaxID=2591008 RepID=A0A545SYW3_9GAMM|nr:tryptophan 2,3-dioxygenase family protein [Exilibacterium tricleocarpae]TQV70154.1 tryptophan 2,3-dioxygenase [Exilibacterium tricleocarpae]